MTDSTESFIIYRMYHPKWKEDDQVISLRAEIEMQFFKGSSSPQKECEIGSVFLNRWINHWKISIITRSRIFNPVNILGKALSDRWISLWSEIRLDCLECVTRREVPSLINTSSTVLHVFKLRLKRTRSCPSTSIRCSFCVLKTSVESHPALKTGHIEAKINFAGQSWRRLAQALFQKKRILKNEIHVRIDSFADFHVFDFGFDFVFVLVVALDCNMFFHQFLSKDSKTKNGRMKIQNTFGWCDLDGELLQNNLKMEDRMCWKRFILDWNEGQILSKRLIQDWLKNIANLTITKSWYEILDAEWNQMNGFWQSQIPSQLFLTDCGDYGALTCICKH